MTLTGALIDTEGYQYKGWVEVLKPFGLSLTTEDYFSYAGKSGEAIEKELLNRFGLRLKKGLLLKRKENLLLDWFRKRRIKPIAHSKSLLRNLKSKGLKIGAASSGSLEEIKLKLERAKLMGYLEVIVSKQHVARSKPYPDIYLLAAKKLGVKPRECIVFEDTSIGVDAAKRAGMRCFAVPNRYTRKQNFSKADRVLRDLSQAKNI